MLHDIVCPMCMKHYPANNVVFRHSADGLVSTGRSVEGYRSVDVYLQSYYARFRVPTGNVPIRLKAVDPACFSESSKRYNGEILSGVDSGDGYILKERICPYCHNKLYASAGRMPMQQMAIIGGTHSGKTTFESTMIYQMMQDGVGCINNTLNEQGALDAVIDNNIEILKRGNPEQNPTTGDAGRLQSLQSWSATENYHGPYIYTLAMEQDKTPVALAFYDLPGEQFASAPDTVALRAQYIGTAQTCLCLLDLQNISTIYAVVAVLQNRFGEQMRQNKVNFAMVLYKADMLSKVIGNLPFSMEPMKLGCRAPINIAQVDACSMELEKFVMSHKGELIGPYNAICSLLSKDNVRLFLAQAFNSKGEFNPQGCEIPLLWSFAKQGLYPSV